jgi:hypothetical protein
MDTRQQQKSSIRHLITDGQLHFVFKEPFTLQTKELDEKAKKPDETTSIRSNVEETYVTESDYSSDDLHSDLSDTNTSIDEPDLDNADPL